jgi:L-amino acid N-acyltransferase YncA
VSPIIRVASLDDAEAIAGIYAPSVTQHVISFELTAPNSTEIAARMTKVLAHYPWLVCEYDGEVIGYAYAGERNERAAYRWSADVSAYVSASAHRRGIGTALYTSLFDILVLQEMRNVYAGITLPNAASEGMHRRMGFTLVGVYHHVGYKFGAWHDVAWFERPLLPTEKDPPEPLSFPRVRDSAEVASALAKGQTLLKRIAR